MVDVRCVAVAIPLLFASLASCRPPALEESTAYGRNSSTAELFACVSNVTRAYFDRHTVHVYFDGTRRAAEYTAAVDAFARAVQSPKVMVPYSSLHPPVAAAVAARGVFAFLAQDWPLLQRGLLNATQQSHFVAVWTEPAMMNDIRRVFHDIWAGGKHVNTLGLVAADDAVRAYTYRPFTSHGCEKLGRPHLLDRWWAGAFRAGVDLFSRRTKTGDMRGCPLTCVGNEHPPDAVLRRDADGRGGWTASGVAGKVLRIVARHMNFTPVITSPKGHETEAYSWYDNAAVLANITATLAADEADLAFGWYSYATHDNEYNTKLARTTSVDCVGWAVPYRAGSPPRPWTNYAYEFDLLGWLFIGSMFVVVVG